MKVVIPAAGLGTRFAGMRLGIPKEMIPLGGRPLIGHALDEAARGGFEVAIVVLSPAKHQVRQFLADTELPIPVEIVVQPLPLGLGDAVLLGWEGDAIGVLLPDDVVLESTHWTNLVAMHREDGAATLCVRPVPSELAGRFGIAECIGDRVVRLVEKPATGTTASNLAVFGRYVVTQAVVDGLRSLRVKGEVELTDGFAAALAGTVGVRAFPFMGEIYDCGTPDSYRTALARFPAIGGN